MDGPHEVAHSTPEPGPVKLEDIICGRAAEDTGQTAAKHIEYLEYPLAPDCQRNYVDQLERNNKSI